MSETLKTDKHNLAIFKDIAGLEIYRPRNNL
jgi:hypothetical protein